MEGFISQEFQAFICRPTKREGIKNHHIIDDIMYMAINQREATFFFKLLHKPLEQSSLILLFTRNLLNWINIVGNQGIMRALIDQLLHRGYSYIKSSSTKNEEKIFS